MKKLILIAALATTPAAAAEEVFFSLRNTEFIVTLAFLLFIAVLFYFKVPTMIGGLLDKRADGIKSELDEARALRDDARTLLESYERKQKEVQAQSARIVATARDEAIAAAAKAREDLAASIGRRMRSAQDQITSAEAAVVRDIRDRAITVAVAAASDMIAAQMTDSKGDALIEASIAQVAAQMH